MSDASWNGKQVLVLGLGDTGLSCIRWLARHGARLRAADTRASPPALEVVRAEFPACELVLGQFAPAALLPGVDAIAASPGIALREPILAEAKMRGIEIVGDIEIFARALQLLGNARPRMIGITGTNGKSTVTAMAGEMCRAAGLDTMVAGNIGLPVLDALRAAEDKGQPHIYAVELSSYQLETTSSLPLDSATVLNVTQDHLDRYDGMADYARAKERIFAHAGTRLVNRDDALSRAMAGAGGTVSFGADLPKSLRDYGIDTARGCLVHGNEDLIALDEIAVPGRHNALNALAAAALVHEAGVLARAALDGLRLFKGLPHRTVLVAQANGVGYYDDSKGTNVGATVAALEGFAQPVVLIAGGDGKGQDFSPLAPAVKKHARAVVLIGRDAPAIEAALQGAGVAVVRAGDMADAVAKAASLAKPGDVVLLSPACASFDMFRNYPHRGEVFTAAARAIVGATH
jgi:UDP-N-acetylmuramoylalanine--D-glutamate ligase